MLQTPSLLFEIQSVQLGMQDCIHIDVSEVVVISWVGGSKWVNCIIAGYNIWWIHISVFFPVVSLCLPVNAFINVAKLRFNILKKGSLTGYFWLPHNVVCSWFFEWVCSMSPQLKHDHRYSSILTKMWGTPVSLLTGVWNPTANTLFESSLSICKCWAPVASCFSVMAVSSSSGTLRT